ncbi:MAG: phage portal protein [Acidobacteriota bacterium]|nr:phage portal protein [Acidobacteriota bacterium]
MATSFSASPELDAPVRVGAMTRMSSVPNVKNTAFEAAGTGRRALGWVAPDVSPNASVLWNLSTLRNRSRQATRNDGFAKSPIDKLVSNVVGTGIKPLSRAADTSLRAQIQELFEQWTDESDADGVLDYYGQQTQATRGWFEGGEAFVRLRPRFLEDGLTVPLQLQILEPEMCPHQHTTYTANGNRIKAGIEFDRIGRRVAYWFHPSRPGDLDDFDRGSLRRVPEHEVIHLFDPLRPGQLRGLPVLTPALTRLFDANKFDDATLLRQQLANMFVAFVTNKDATDGADSPHPLTGLSASQNTAKRPLVPLEPGLFQELDPGQDVKFSEPPAVGEMYPEFMRQQLMAACVAVGVPYEVVTGDLRNLNDRIMRVLLAEFRRRIQAWQHQIIGFQLCRRVWLAWLNAAFLAGKLPFPNSYLADPTPFTKVKWMPQGWAYLHPVQDVEADQKAIRNGFTSRASVVSEHGEDVEQIDQQQKDDNARADQMGLKHDSDGRVSLKGSTPEAKDVEDTNTQPQGAQQ